MTITLDVYDLTGASPLQGGGFRRSPWGYKRTTPERALRYLTDQRFRVKHGEYEFPVFSTTRDARAALRARGLLS